MASNTGSSSPGELLMTFSTSEVAVCCSSASLEIVRALAQLVEQPRVLDGDDRLIGEILHQLDLLVGERPHFLAVDDDNANQLVFLEHRHGEDSPIAAKLGSGHGDWIALLNVERLLRDVGALDHLLGPCRAAKGEHRDRGAADPAG